MNYIIEAILVGIYTCLIYMIFSRFIKNFFLLLQNKKNTIGLRIPDNHIASAIVAALEHPILSASLPGEMVEDYTDPYVIHENFEKLVDIVIDGGIGGMIPSTIVDCTTDDYTVIREGAGVWEG